MRRHELAHDREAEPGAAGRSGARRVCAVEAVEHVRKVLGRDAGAVVPDRDLQELPFSTRGDGDAPAGGGMDGCVGEKVSEDLAQAFAVHASRWKVGGHEELEPQRRHLGPRPDRADGVLGRFRQWDARERQTQLARLSDREFLASS